MQNKNESKISAEDGPLLRGGQVIGVDGDFIGVIGAMLLDPATPSPQWVTVGFDEAGYALIPLTGAYRDGQNLQVPFTGAQVRAAPGRGHVDALAPDDEQVLRDYYAEARARGTDQR
ncbi:PRC-barrel domain-containing protein [Rhodococcus globerulus]|uniref:PRC-barrel domain-containing protein n=1 Tax=Rhodococcus globerulus TaxID=33008 RepID=A0ABU4C594_RHOGO|nr:PRC-barrel domain-containing protein [Rhodococcus globerulus]MDV6271671.1 PRC-barrel domain-containing protein [Rhodococcus globerulus]